MLNSVWKIKLTLTPNLLSVRNNFWPEIYVDLEIEEQRNRIEVMV